MYTPLNWTTTQRHVAFASFTSWMLDAFDFFILVFVLSDLAEWFHASVSDVSIAIMLTLAVRPIGAVAILICVFVAFGRETRGVVISGTDSDALPESAISHRT
ncbi:hypothetical protein E2D11_01620 [Salmonella enterica subsp. enterica serovar Kentucky]|nr:hypothetical protein [Salmonella enterica subsp. enterica serovar Kentucky]